MKLKIAFAALIALLLGLAVFISAPANKVGAESTKQISDVFDNINTTTWISAGSMDAKHKAYVFININCSHCQQLLQTFKPLIDDGSLEIRFILIAFRENSIRQNATILNQIDNAARLKLLYADHAAYINKDLENRVPPAKQEEAAAAYKQITDNTAYMHNHGYTSTPMILYKQPDGSINIHIGYVNKSQIPFLLNQIGNSW